MRLRSCPKPDENSALSGTVLVGHWSRRWSRTSSRCLAMRVRRDRLRGGAAGTGSSTVGEERARLADDEHAENEGCQGTRDSCRSRQILGTATWLRRWRAWRLLRVGADQTRRGRA